MKFSPNDARYEIDQKLAKYDGLNTVSLEESNDAKMVLADALINPDCKNNECIGKEFWCSLPPHGGSGLKCNKIKNMDITGRNDYQIMIDIMKEVDNMYWS